MSHHEAQISGPRKDASKQVSKHGGWMDQDAELPSIQRAASKGTVQLLGHANHKPISKTTTMSLAPLLPLEHTYTHDEIG